MGAAKTTGVDANVGTDAAAEILALRRELGRLFPVIERACLLGLHLRFAQPERTLLALDALTSRHIRPAERDAAFELAGASAVCTAHTYRFRQVCSGLEDLGYNATIARRALATCLTSTPDPAVVEALDALLGSGVYPGWTPPGQPEQTNANTQPTMTTRSRRRQKGVV